MNEDKPYEDVREDTYWTTGTGDELTLAEMEKSHLQNAILFLNRKQEECTAQGLGDYEVNDHSAFYWMKLFRKELKYREALLQPQVVGEEIL